ncbi:MAG: NYN domain-containing protein [Pseudomonadota bacterium]|uniref:NYN domain-containing protein n=1 Tax=Candidatus Desulfatibia profunda TaxID=2841695 RepID=A0A8J6NMJ4_9BACT|nr:NYN domain-containing protein [Candidatus Desulfatibia profunda]MBL7178631.1 NYN domain-containing protein [Desulfobacterales bacterium]
MSIHIIIDGYNLIRQSRFFSPLDSQDMQLGRETLIDTLAAYKRIKGHKITIVFDGARAPLFSASRDQIKGIKIKFSRSGESADTVIKRMAAREKEKALIVSSDLDVINFASSRGCATITSLRFEEKIAMAAHMDTKKIHRGNEGGRTSTTKKKGPSRRLSKKKRKSMAKIQKL